MRLWLKMVLVGAMTLVILIPLAMVNDIISDRQAYRAAAVSDVVRSYAGAQAVAGPVLTVPYSETVDVEEAGADGIARHVRRRREAQWTFFPTRLDVHGPLVPSTRRRGLFDVPVYEWAGTLVADFDARLPAAAAGGNRTVGTPVLGYRITDVRGIHGVPRLRVAGADVEVREGVGTSDVPGLHARLASPGTDGRIAVSTRLDLQLAGTASFAVVPLGKRSRVDLASAWPHPSFQGLSPWRSSVSSRGFKAEWQVASVATDAQRQLLAGRTVQPFAAGAAGEPHAAGPALDALGVVLGDPVDAYTRADRATKYGILFVVLTFVGFFMFEVVRQVPIHPVQYGLVGLALVLFFLLLVSLSEQVAFGIAYVVASAACIGLIGFYLSAVLRSTLHGTAFAAALALLYAALYGLLISEDNALVLGAGLLFVVLAALMIATRRLDWYRVGTATPPPLP